MKRIFNIFYFWHLKKKKHWFKFIFSKRIEPNRPLHHYMREYSGFLFKLTPSKFLKCFYLSCANSERLHSFLYVNYIDMDIENTTDVTIYCRLRRLVQWLQLVITSHATYHLRIEKRSSSPHLQTVFMSRFMFFVALQMKKIIITFLKIMGLLKEWVFLRVKWKLARKNNKRLCQNFAKEENGACSLLER